MKTKKMHRREFLRSSGLITMGFLFSGCSRILTEKSARQRPNILLIMSDDHASQAISCYGSRINQTPNIDRIAKKGICLTNCFCTNSICAPSRAAILTGKYGHLNGVIDNSKTFNGSQETFPKLFQKSGYETALIGKWHLKSQPTGFDHWHILPGQGAYFDPWFIQNGQKTQHKGYVTDIITNQAIEWLKQRNNDHPFCLLVHHKAPHADWDTTKKHKQMYHDVEIAEPVTFNDDYKSRSDAIRTSFLKVGKYQWDLHYKRRFGEIPQTVPQEKVKSWMYQRYMKDYLGCIASIDDNVGRLLDYLDEAKLTNNTLVIYTSDQGFFLGEHGLYDKRFMYEEGLRMPFVACYPGAIPKKSTSQTLALNLDFAPTLLDFAGVGTPHEMQGRSLRTVLQGKTPVDWRKAIYYRFYEKAYNIGPHEGIRTKRYKLIHFLYGDYGWELYDLQEDPDELRNLYNDPACSQIQIQLKSTLQELRREYMVTEPAKAIK
jgi:arylsulfatase A-like enzyme